MQFHDVPPGGSKRPGGYLRRTGSLIVGKACVDDEIGEPQGPRCGKLRPGRYREGSLDVSVYALLKLDTRDYALVQRS